MENSLYNILFIKLKRYQHMLYIYQLMVLYIDYNFYGMVYKDHDYQNILGYRYNLFHYILFLGHMFGIQHLSRNILLNIYTSGHPIHY